MDLQANPVNEILYVAFNQDFTCFVCGTKTGFRVYSTNPFRLTFRRNFNDDGVGVIGMLFRTNILAFSGSTAQGSGSRFQPHKVVLWDDRQERVIAELSFKTAVQSVRLRKDLVVVAIEKKVYVYGFRSLSLFDSVETISNPKGLCCLSVGPDQVVLVCPGIQKGHALVVFYPRAFGDLHAPVARERTTIIQAHESSLGAMATDANGTMLATASEKGTIIRVFNSATGERTHELRRGADQAEVHSLNFNQTAEWLVAASDKGTVHVFSTQREPVQINDVESTEVQLTPSNAKSSFHRMSRVLPWYFSSQWSFAQFRVPDYRCIAAFCGEPHSIVVLCANGFYFKARFDPARGGEMTRAAYERFDAGQEERADDAAATSALTAATPSSSSCQAAADTEVVSTDPVSPEATAVR
mmetsp:Transcript_27945/g.64491  ORF Transcript_27945/g.64491 Transcript_27945/m.64491 type:complete len:412 (-) Transcript_27945:15-1250(-)